MKKVMILSTSYGQGHMAASRAIKEAFDKLYSRQVEVEIIDFTEKINSLLNKTSKKAYGQSAKYAPVLYKLFFDSTDNTASVKVLNELSYVFNRSKILQFFAEKNPDLIVCTAPHWQYIVSLAQADEYQTKPVVSVITDSITLHTAWSVGSSLLYFVPNPETARSLRRQGVDSKTIVYCGYPISLKFLKKPNISTINKKLGLTKNDFVILYSAATEKLNYCLQLLQLLCQNIEDCKVVVVCGTDEALQAALTKTNLPSNTKLLGWTRSMAELILCSNIVIAKAGGSTVMECIGAKKPVIINKVLPGQEEGNAQYVQSHRLGLVAENPSEVVAAAKYIKTHISVYKKHLQTLAKPYAAEAIAKTLYKKFLSKVSLKVL